MTTSPVGAALSRLRTLLDPADAKTTDRELLERFVTCREHAAFSELVRRHGPMVLGVCRRVPGDAHAAEDAFQAVFLVLVRRARAVNWRESLGGWLHGAARRVALRAMAQRGRGLDAARVPLPSTPPDPSEEAEKRAGRRRRWPATSTPCGSSPVPPRRTGTDPWRGCNRATTSEAGPSTSGAGSARTPGPGPSPGRRGTARRWRAARSCSTWSRAWAT